MFINITQDRNDEVEQIINVSMTMYFGIPSGFPNIQWSLRNNKILKVHDIEKKYNPSLVENASLLSTLVDIAVREV